jgi:hypothetical protein
MKEVLFICEINFLEQYLDSKQEIEILIIFEEFKLMNFSFEVKYFSQKKFF